MSSPPLPSTWGFNLWEGSRGDGMGREEDSVECEEAEGLVFTWSLEIAVGL